MRTQRAIWRITGAVVVVAAIILVVRKAGEKSDTAQPSAPSRLPTAAEQQLIASMKTTLERDAPAEKPETKAAIQAVAELAERGALRTAETLYALGLQRTEQGAYPEAERALREAIGLQPQWSWPYNGLGILLANHANGRAAEAEDLFRTAIRLDPAWSRPHNDLAILLRMVGRLDEAETEAVTALRLHPDSVAAYNNYGNLLVARKRFADAEQAYKRAIELDPDHPKPYYNLACVYSLQDRAAEALPLLAKAIALHPALRDDARRDPDLEPLRGDLAFEQLVSQTPNTP